MRKSIRETNRETGKRLNKGEEKGFIFCNYQKNNLYHCFYSHFFNHISDTGYAVYKKTIKKHLRISPLYYLKQVEYKK